MALQAAFSVFDDSDSGDEIESPAGAVDIPKALLRSENADAGENSSKKGSPPKPLEWPVDVWTNRPPLRMGPAVHNVISMNEVGGGREFIAATDVNPGTLLVAEEPIIQWHLKTSRSRLESQGEDYPFVFVAVDKPPRNSGESHEGQHAFHRQVLTAIVTHPRAFEVVASLAPLHPVRFEDMENPLLLDHVLVEYKDIFTNVMSCQEKTWTTVGEGTLPIPSTKGLARLILVLRFNAFATGLYLHLSIFNHHCQPNCTKYSPFADDGETALGYSEVRATRFIKKGEPLTISYLHPCERAISTRRRDLHSQFHFMCQCDACQSYPMPTDGFRLFVGDISPTVTDELFNQVFAHFTSLIEAKIVRNKQTQKSKGFGFVSFGDAVERDLALATMNMFIVGSRPLKLSPSKTKDEVTIIGAEETVESMLQLLEKKFAKECRDYDSNATNILAYKGIVQGPFDVDLGDDAVISNVDEIRASKRSLLCNGICVCAFAFEALQRGKPKVLPKEQEQKTKSLENIALAHTKLGEASSCMKVKEHHQKAEQEVRQIMMELWEPKPQAVQEVHSLQIRASRFVVECLAKGIEVMMQPSPLDAVTDRHRSVLPAMIGDPSNPSQWPLRTELLLSFISSAADLLRLQLSSLGPDHIDVARTRKDISVGISRMLSNKTDTRALQEYSAYCKLESREHAQHQDQGADIRGPEADWMWHAACVKGFRGASIYEHKQMQEYKRIQTLYT